jgi:fibronectin type 3 domain-containing protein
MCKASIELVFTMKGAIQRISIVLLICMMLIIITVDGMTLGLSEDQGTTVDDCQDQDGMRSRSGSSPGFQYGTIFETVPTDNIYIYKMDVDTAGNVLVAGRTNSDVFPTTAGAFDSTLSGSSDLFVTKFDPTLSSIIYSTLIGGSGTESVEQIISAQDGGVYLVGHTSSSDFPVTDGSYCTTYKGEQEAFVLKVDNQGKNLEFSTFIGGSDDDYAYGMAFDSSDNLCVAGYTKSTDFPVTAGSFDTIMDGQRDAFVLKFNAEMTGLDFSTLIGGSGNDTCIGIKMRSDDSFILAGSTEGDFPTTPAAYSDSFIDDGYYILRMSSTGTGLIYSTLTPDGSGQDDLEAFTVDVLGNVYLVGDSESTDFPTTADAQSRTLNSRHDGVFYILSDAGKNLSYSTYINSNDTNGLNDVALNKNGTKMAIGGSVMGDGLPVTDGAFDKTWRGETEDMRDGLLLVFDTSTLDLDYATYIGGSRQDIAMTLAWDENGVVHLGGRTSSGDFYTSSGAYDEVHGAADQGFIVKIDPRPGRVPSAPSAFRGMPTTSDISLTWDRPSEEGGCRINGYLFEKLNPNMEWNELNTSYAFRYYDQDVMNGKTYRYRVSAKSDAGHGAHAMATVTVPPVEPTAPRDLTAGTGNGTVTLNWSVPSLNGGARVEGYVVRKGPTRSEMAKLADIGNTTVYIDTNVELGEFVYYEVAAKNSAGIGPPSNAVRIKPLDIPGSPWNLRLEARDRSVRLTWDEPMEDGGSMLLGYYVYRGTNIDSIERYATMTSMQLEHTDSSVVNGRTYIYYVTAFSEVGESEPTQALDANPFGKPGRSTDLTATPGDGQVVLEWSPPSDAGGRPITKYKVFAGASPGEMTLMATIGNITTFVHSDLANGITYHYQVIAVNEAGDGLVSETASARPMGIPGHVTSFRAFSVVNGVRLTWVAPDDLGGANTVAFVILKGQSKDSSEEIAVVTEMFEYLDSDVLPGITYFYWIQTRTPHTDGPITDELEVTVMTVPGTVIGLAVIYGDGSIELDWDPPVDDGGSPVTQYVVLRGIFVTGLVEVGGTVGATNFTDTGLDNGKEYLYAVYAMNRVGPGAHSDVVEGTPLGPPGLLRQVQAKAEGKSIVLTWAAPTDSATAPLTGYRVLRATRDTDFEVIAEIGDTTTYTDEDVREGVRYQYKVQALSDIGDGIMSGTVDAMVKKSDDSPGFTSAVLIVAITSIVSLSRSWKHLKGRNH